MVVLFPATLTAQALSLRQAEPPPAVASLFADSGQTAPHVIRWYEAAAALGGVAVLTAVDEPLQRYTQRHRSQTSNDVARYSPGAT